MTVQQHEEHISKLTIQRDEIQQQLDLAAENKADAQSQLDKAKQLEHEAFAIAAATLTSAPSRSITSEPTLRLYMSPTGRRDRPLTSIGSSSHHAIGPFLTSNQERPHYSLQLTRTGAKRSSPFPGFAWVLLEIGGGSSWREAKWTYGALT